MKSDSLSTTDVLPEARQGPRQGGGQGQLSSQRGSSCCLPALSQIVQMGRFFTRGLKTLGRGDARERGGDSSLGG